ncbi:cyclic nucleotide-binding domain-containing protein [Azospirillum sp. Marseille-Q6669]
MGFTSAFVIQNSRLSCHCDARPNSGEHPDMAKSIQFKSGDLLFRRGDASDCVLWVKHGEIEVLRENGDNAILIGHVRGGEWLGEMGVIEGRSRSATARAVSDGAAEVLSPQEFLDRVSRDASLARGLIQRLSIRLRTIEDKIAGDLLLSTREAETAENGAPSSEALTNDNERILLTAGSDSLRSRIGPSSIQVGQLPFVVGRLPINGEAPPPRSPDLSIDDQPPFRLSRDHFMISRSQGRLLVSDLGSTLGTVVNGQPIGHDFMRDTALLNHGENRVVAGGWGSPFEFIVSIG